MKNERKILKHIHSFKNSTPYEEQTMKGICKSLGIDYDDNLRVFNYLCNRTYIDPYMPPGYIGSTMLTRDALGITANGVDRIDEWLPKKIRFYAPIFISVGALGIAIMAYFKQGV